MRPAMILALLTALIVPATALAQADSSTPAPQAPGQIEQEQAEQDQPGDKAPATHKRSSAFVNGELQTLPRDPKFGQRLPGFGELFQDNNQGLAAVDRRREISSMADRNILAPMAQTPAEGTVSYSNYNFFGNYLTYAASDKLAVTAGMVIPSGTRDFVTSVSGKYKIHESRDWLVSVLPFGAYSNGTLNIDTYQFGLGGGLLADFHAMDSLVLTGGALGFATLAAGYDRYSDNCTRSEFSSENCNVETVNITLPAGGHWIAATLGANWFLTEKFAFNLEYILGGSWGTFFGVEDSAAGNDLAARRDRFENPDFASGFPHGQGPTMSLGATWSNGTSALQFAVVVVRGRDNPDTFVTDEGREYQPFPLLSGAFHF